MIANKTSSSLRRAARKDLGKIARAVIFMGIFFLFAADDFPQADPDEWDRQTADKMEALLPSPTAGLTERLPWDPQDYGRVQKSWGCGESVCATYKQVTVTRSWRFEDPKLVKEYEALVKQEEAWIKRSEELGRKISPQEIMQIQTEMQKIEDQKKKIESGSRTIEVSIRLNQNDPVRQSVETKPAGTIGQYSFYRKENNSFVAYLGPRGFENPDLPKGQSQRLEVKIINVEVQLSSNPVSFKSDETAARHMMERIDYQGLTKLLAH